MHYLIAGKDWNELKHLYVTKLAEETKYAEAEEKQQKNEEETQKNPQKRQY